MVTLRRRFLSRLMLLAFEHINFQNNRLHKYINLVMLQRLIQVVLQKPFILNTKFMYGSN